MFRTNIEWRRRMSNRRRPWTRLTEPRPIDRGHVFHTRDAYRVLKVLGLMGDTVAEEVRVSKLLATRCAAGHGEKVGRGMWRRVLK
jgi:hypothetical protein